MFPIPGLPSPTVLIAAAIAIVVAFAAGDYRGYSKEHEKFLTFQAEVKAAGDLAEAKNKAIVAGHEAVTAKVSQDAQTKLAALQEKADEALKVEHFAHVQDIQSLQSPHAAEKQQATESVKNDFQSKIAAIHAAYAGRLRGSTDPGGGHVPALSLSTPPAYDHAAYDVLAANCAVTTQMLISLQQWVHDQGAVQ